MHFTRFPRSARLLIAFAFFQAFAPSFVAIADAWRTDERTPYAHAESETGQGCVLVHRHDCVLCSVATAPTGAPAREWAFPLANLPRVASPATRELPHAEVFPALASQRAPPAARG